MDVLMHCLGMGPEDISIEFDRSSDISPRRHITTKENEVIPFFEDTKRVSGTVKVSVKPGFSIDFSRIKVEYIGRIEVLRHTEDSQDILYLKSDVDGEGTLKGDSEYKFSFMDPDGIYETYRGKNIQLRYFVRITVTRTLILPDIVKEADIWIQRPREREPEWISREVPMDPNILIIGAKTIFIRNDDGLSVKCSFPNTVFQLVDLGRVQVKVEPLANPLKVNHMEGLLIKREIAGLIRRREQSDSEKKSWVLSDGVPVPGSKAVNYYLDLCGCEGLTPTYKNVSNKFSVKYYIRVVITDENGKKWHEEQEIVFWRPLFWMNSLSQGTPGINLTE